LTFSDKGLLLLVEDCSIRQRVLCKKDFGWIALWGLNPEVMGSLWLMASTTSAEGPMIGEGGPCPFLNYTLAIALQLRKSTENLCQGSRVVGDYPLRRLG
jgi:hypothetical protein